MLKRGGEEGKGEKLRREGLPLWDKPIRSRENCEMHVFTFYGGGHIYMYISTR
jgi:hypothetical protein